MHVRAQPCPTLCDPVDCSLPRFSVHGILQARILEWVAIPFSTGSSQPRDWTRVSTLLIKSEKRRKKIWDLQKKRTKESKWFPVFLENSSHEIKHIQHQENAQPFMETCADRWIHLSDAETWLLRTETFQCFHFFSCLNLTAEILDDSPRRVLKGEGF